MKELQEFKKLLKEKKTDNNNNYNIQSMKNDNFYPGIYNIKNKDINIFIKLYCHIVFEQNKNVCFLEKPINCKNVSLLDKISDSNLIKIDIDLKYNNKELLEHTYNSDLISKLINLYYKELIKYVNLDEKCSYNKNNIINNLQFYVLERKEAYKDIKNNKIKDGIHIIVPHLLINNSILHKVRLELIKNKDFIKLHKDFNQLNNITDFIDESVISRNAWFLYGSGKQNRNPYLLSKIYKFVKNDDVFEKISDEKLEKKKKDKIELVRSLSNFDIKQKINPINNQILETLYSLNNFDNNENNTKIIKTTYNDNVNLSIIKPISNIYSANDLKSIIDCFLEERSNNFIDWRKIGQALYNIDHKKGKKVWKYFSQKCIEKYNENVINSTWKEFEIDYMKCKYQCNIKYLKQLARKDNREKYETINIEKKKKILDEIIDAFNKIEYASKMGYKIGDATFAKEIKKLIDSEGNVYFIYYENNKESVWFYYKNHKWEKDDKGQYIQNYFKNKALKLFKEHLIILTENNTMLLSSINSNSMISNSNNSDSDENSDSDNDCDNDNTFDRGTNSVAVSLNKIYIEICKSIIIYLESSANRVKLLKELSNEFYDKDFINNLDINPYLFHFTNGVFDIKNFEFRDGNPDDRISLSSNVKYISNTERYEEKEYIDEEDDYNEFLEKLFPEEELREYIFNILSICLIGENIQQKFRIMHGGGSNGKSYLFDLIKISFGDYFKTIPTTVFTDIQKASGSASPEIAHMMKAKIIMGNEIQSGVSLNTSTIKMLTGGDSISYRPLYSSQKEGMIQGTVFLVCNDTPSNDNTDHASWRRMSVMPFISTFCDSNDKKLKNKKKYPYHFKKNFKFNKIKLNKFISLFMNDLINYLEKLKDNKYEIIEPKIVKDSLEEYKSSKCIFQSFMNDRLVKTVGEKLYVDNIFLIFRNYTDECNHKYRSNKTMFDTELSRVIGPSILRNGSRYWKNWTVREVLNEDEIDNSDSDSEP